MYLVLVEKSGAEDGLSSAEIMFYNSILSLPFLLFLIVATGEFPNSLSILLAKVRILTGLYSHIAIQSLFSRRSTSSGIHNTMQNLFAYFLLSFVDFSKSCTFASNAIWTADPT